MEASILLEIFKSTLYVFYVIKWQFPSKDVTENIQVGLIFSISFTLNAL